ncbi:MAG: multidrug ABC transporter ATP-binding protein [Zetaproteobacteria bacterium]|nr:multidrug ABC transporter ATP-binding protein [Pseudobdellovibrionaceae bacterium]
MINAKQLTRKYGSFTAIQDLNFSIPRGQIVGLLGHNGAGKTTTLKILTGYMEATSGSISIGGVDVQENRQDIQKNLGYLPEVSPLYPEMTVWQYLDHIADLRNISSEKKNSAIAEAIKATELGDKAASYINTLSKGYRQRVGVAQAIIHKPEILILDEPTNGLDPSQIITMRNLIKNLSKTSTVIISTHIMQEVEAICDRVIIILNGKIALDSDLSQLKASENQLIIGVNAEYKDVLNSLSSINGINEIQDLQSSSSFKEYSIKLDENCDHNINPTIVKKVSEQGWDLYKLTTEQRTLETIFKEVNSKLIEGAQHV